MTIKPSIITVGTRGSNLAMVQTKMALDHLKSMIPELDYRIQIIRSHGDMDQTTPLYRFKKRNTFGSTLENALIHHEVDLCIHSLKDLPSTPIDGSNHVFHPFHICLIFWPHCFYPYLANVRSSPDCSVDVNKSRHRYHTLRCSWHYG